MEVIPFWECWTPLQPRFNALRYPPAHADDARAYRPRSGAKDGYEALIRAYLERCAAFARCRTEAIPKEKALLEWLDGKGRTPAVTVLLEAAGQQMRSEAWRWLGARRDQGASISSLPLARRMDGRGGARAGGAAAFTGADDAGPRPGATGDGGTDLPGIYNSDWPSVSRGTLRSRDQVVRGQWSVVRIGGLWFSSRDKGLDCCICKIQDWL